MTFPSISPPSRQVRQAGWTFLKSVLFALILLLQLTCNKEKHFGGPNSMQEDFESCTNTDSLFKADESRWSFNQKTRDANFIMIDTAHHHGGNNCLKFYAVKSDENSVSKCSIVKQHMAFYEGDVVVMTTWYYIEGNAKSGWLFLYDLEEQASVGAGPGMRLANTENNFLAEESKFFNPTAYQESGSEIALPRNQWVKIEVEIKLSQKKKGYLHIRQNNQLIISKDNFRTLPKDFLYSQQGTKGMYTSIEFGITANTKDNDMVLYLDDVDVHTR